MRLHSFPTRRSSDLRFQVFRRDPVVILDGAHNPAGAREIQVFWEQFLPGRKIFLIYGAVRDKAVDEVAGILFPGAQVVIITSPAQPRAISAALLGEMTSHHAAKAEVIPDPEKAFERALELASAEDVIFVTGSLYLVGDLRRYWFSRTAATGNVFPASSSPSSS